MSDYLFDKEGDPDPELARLEGLLAPLAYRGEAPPLPARARAGRWRRPLVIAAATATAAVLVLLLARPWRPAAASWAATVSGGTATSDGHALDGAGRLAVGAWLETGAARVRLTVADIGSVELGPATRARIVATGAARHELALARGSLVATIDAPPRRFVVATPRATVTDLGCAFELTVDEAGRGQLAVRAGRVAVASPGGEAREVEVPAGSRVELSERGPGTPYVAATGQPATPARTPSVPVPSGASQQASPAMHPSHPSTTQPHHAIHAPSAKHSSPASSSKTSPKSTTPAATHAPSATKPAPAAKVEHDPLKELERSVE